MQKLVGDFLFLEGNFCGILAGILLVFSAAAKKGFWKRGNCVKFGFHQATENNIAGNFCKNPFAKYPFFSLQMVGFEV